MALPEFLANTPTPGVAAGLTTLSGNGGSITSGAASMKTAAVAPATLQGTGQFRVLIDSEYMVIDASTANSTTWTIITRGDQGTTAASHNDAAVVWHVWTYDSLNQFITSSPTNASTAVLKSADFTAVAGQQNIVTGAHTGTLPSAPVSGAEVGIVSLTGTVTVNRGGTDTIEEYGITTKTTTSIPAGTAVVYKYLSGVWYRVRDSRPIGWNTTGRATRVAAWTTGANTTVKVPLDTVTFDLGSNWDVTTNRRYTAPVAGYYHVEGGATLNAPITEVTAQLFKNGSLVQWGLDMITDPAAQHSDSAVFSDIVQLAANDFVEFWLFTSAAVAGDVAAGQQAYMAVTRVA